MSWPARYHNPTRKFFLSSVDAMAKLYGQIVVGPPGSGKSTYCGAVQHFFEALPRPHAVVNLDPANDCALPYECSVDVRQLVDSADVMAALRLGPNGALVYAIDYVHSRLDWLETRLEQLRASNSRTHIIIDMPGQVELYTHDGSVRRILARLREWGCRLCVVNLADSHYCSDPGKFISVLLSALCTTVQLEMPLINVLSKGDLLRQYGPLPFRLDYFMEAMDLRHLLRLLNDDPFTAKFNKLSEQLVSVIEDYGLVGFMLLSVNDKESMKAVIAAADKANGFVYRETDAPDPRKIMDKHSEHAYSSQRDAVDKYGGD